MGGRLVLAGRPIKKRKSILVPSGVLAELAHLRRRKRPTGVGILIFNAGGTEICLEIWWQVGVVSLRADYDLIILRGRLLQQLVPLSFSPLTKLVFEAATATSSRSQAVR